MHIVTRLVASGLGGDRERFNGTSGSSLCTIAGPLGGGATNLMLGRLRDEPTRDAGSEMSASRQWDR